MGNFKYVCEACRVEIYFSEKIDTERYFCPDSKCGHLTLRIAGYCSLDALEILELHQKIDTLGDVQKHLWAEVFGEDLPPAEPEH